MFNIQCLSATIERKLDILVKAMTTHNISPIQQIAQVEVCAKWARRTILQKTINTLTLIMQGSKTTPIFHGVIIRMCRMHKGSKEISSRELTIKLYHKQSNKIQS
jgi:hypothetical protein